MRNRLKKLFSFIVKYDVLKTLYWRLRLRLPRNASFHICPHSIVDIDKSALLKLTGELVVNNSWFKTRKRRYKSEFRLDGNATCICEGDFMLFQGASVYVGPNAKLVVHGGWSVLNTNTTLNCFQYIEIGKGCMISDNVCISDSDTHCIDDNKDKVMAPIVMEDHVWIGKNVTILKGVTLGCGSVIGAGSVVTKDVPRNTIVAGNPARPIKEITSWK